jgi:hypothetical protein
LLFISTCMQVTFVNVVPETICHIFNGLLISFMLWFSYAICSRDISVCIYWVLVLMSHFIRKITRISH